MNDFREILIFDKKIWKKPKFFVYLFMGILDFMNETKIFSTDVLNILLISLKKNMCGTHDGLLFKLCDNNFSLGDIEFNISTRTRIFLCTNSTENVKKFYTIVFSRTTMSIYNSTVW